MLSGERAKARARPPRCRKRSEESRGWRAASLIFSTNLASRHMTQASEGDVLLHGLLFQLGQTVQSAGGSGAPGRSVALAYGL